MFTQNAIVSCSLTGCPNEGSHCCSRCKFVKYCSRECQKADWKGHKKDSQIYENNYSTQFTNVAESKSTASVGDIILTKKSSLTCPNASCKNEGNFACSRCKSASYCSKECQKAAWKLHKADFNEFLEIPLQKPDASNKIKVKKMIIPNNATNNEWSERMPKEMRDMI